MGSKLGYTFAALGGILWLSACGRADPTLLPEEPREFLIESAELLQAESWPVQLRLELTGLLPSACHSLDYSVVLPAGEGVIEVEAQAKLTGGSDCAGESRSFRQGIGLGSYTEGNFQVLLNGEPVGEFNLGRATRPPESGEADGELDRGPVYIDEAELAILESFPVQVELVIRGTLPTPCASLEWSAQPPDEQGRILVEVYSVQDPGLACIQVLQDLEERLPIGSYSEGSYSVWLNGDLVGEFDG